MQEYDEFCKKHLINKIPQWRNREDKHLRVGDCIYDYANGEPPKLRQGVHTEDNRKRDLGGGYALLSNHFYYFGKGAITLPQKLYPIIHTTQGHKSEANGPYTSDFISWIQTLGLELNKLYGYPQLWELEFNNNENDEELRFKCAKRDLDADEEDEISENKM